MRCDDFVDHISFKDEKEMLFPAHDVYPTVKKNRTNDIDYQKKDYLCNRIFKSTLTHYCYSFAFISICIYIRSFC